MWSAFCRRLSIDACRSVLVEQVEIRRLYIAQVSRIYVGVDTRTNFELLQIVRILRQDILRIALHVIELEIHHKYRPPFFYYHCL